MTRVLAFLLPRVALRPSPDIYVRVSWLGSWAELCRDTDMSADTR